MPVEKDINEGDRLLERLGVEFGDACAVIVTEKRLSNGERSRESVFLKDIETARELLGLSVASARITALPHLIILVHGINTRALWMGEIKRALERSGFTVEPTSYGTFSVLRFLSPFIFFAPQSS